jgi:hypothetical protein
MRQQPGKVAYMKVSGTIIVLAAALTAALVRTAGAATTAPASPAQLREFEGTVVSVNRDARTFRLRDAERGTVRIKVTRRTRFERLSGFSALRRGLKRVEAKVRRQNGVGWRPKWSAPAAAASTAAVAMTIGAAPTTTAATTTEFDSPSARNGQAGRCGRERSRG